MMDLADLDWKNLPGHLTDSVDLYNRVLLQLLNKHAPIKNLLVVQRKSSTWINNDILKLKRKRR